MKKSVIPGSFDPITLGHLDLIERSAKLFDEVIVAVSVNSEKRSMFTLEERLEMIEAACAHIPNVRAAVCDGLLASFVIENGAAAIVKGIRNATDSDYELWLAEINRSIDERIETVVLPARTEYRFITSTFAREMIKYGVELDKYLPAPVVKYIKNK